MNGANFSALSFGLGDAQIKYGMFIQAMLDFAIVAFVLFMIVRAITTAKDKMSKKKEKTEEEVVIASLTKDQELLEEIRDLLKKTK
jgi:large conductance mechanosensitive channel